MSQQLPPGVLPPGITVPPGTDIMQFCRDLAESGADFAEQFDRDSATFHGGNATAVPTGGTRVPESMKSEAPVDWQSLPEAPLAVEQDFGPEYHAAMAARKKLEECKKAISILNKPVEMSMKLRVQYNGAEGDDKTALLGRLKGAENQRDGALAAATQAILDTSNDEVSERTRACVKEVADRGKFNFDDKSTFGEYIQVLQRAGQAIFADQKKLLQKIKDIKKAAKDDSKGKVADEVAPTKAATEAGGA